MCPAMFPVGRRCKNTLKATGWSPYESLRSWGTPYVVTWTPKPVHGDFHPWNILFQEGAKYRLLDRSRGEWGEPADDVTCLTNELPVFLWERYLRHSGDTEILDVAAPFFGFRGLVMAHPVWYPHLSPE